MFNLFYYLLSFLTILYILQISFPNIFSYQLYQNINYLSELKNSFLFNLVFFLFITALSVANSPIAFILALLLIIAYVITKSTENFQPHHNTTLYHKAPEKPYISIDINSGDNPIGKAYEEKIGYDNKIVYEETKENPQLNCSDKGDSPVGKAYEEKIGYDTEDKYNFI